MGLFLFIKIFDSGKKFILVIVHSEGELQAVQKKCKKIRTQKCSDPQSV